MSAASGPHLGIYAHHVGAGHIARAHAVARAWPGPVTLLTSRARSLHQPDGLHVVALPDDDAPTGAGTPSTLHHAPLGHDGLRRRMATIAAWLGGAAPDVVLVDVSVEVALLVRLHGVPTAVVRHPGEREDPAHLLQWRTVDRVLAPWGVPGARDGVEHVGLLSRFDDRTPPARPATPHGRRRLVVAVGAGGTGARPEHVRRLVRDLGSAWEVAVLGATWGPGASATGATQLGWVDDPWPELCAADVVLGSCSLNLTAEVAASGAAFVAVPEPRPHWEQHAHGDELARRGVPVASCWDDDLAALVRRADEGPVPALSDRRGAERLVTVLHEVAGVAQEVAA